jgi:hypothetical protein
MVVDEDFDSIDTMVISWCCAMRDEFVDEMSVPLGLAYTSFIQSSVNHTSSEAKAISC